MESAFALMRQGIPGLRHPDELVALLALLHAAGEVPAFLRMAPVFRSFPHRSSPWPGQSLGRRSTPSLAACSRTGLRGGGGRRAGVAPRACRADDACGPRRAAQRLPAPPASAGD
jgi:hypothetical protein